MGDLAQLDAAMTAVLDMIPGRRRRSPLEARWQLTQTYARLIVAAGFARLGDHARARALRDECVTALPNEAGDPVHRFLLDAYALRVEQTCERRRVDLPLPPSLVEQLVAMTRVGRYTVDRLREGSPILSAARRPPVRDPIDVYHAQTYVPDEPLDPDLDALRAIASTAARAHAIDQLLTSAPLDDVPRLAAAFTALGDFAEGDALPILAPAIRRLVSSAEVPCLLGERAITAAARFGYAELIPELLTSVLAARSELATVAPRLLRALRRLDARADLYALLTTIEVPPSDPPSAGALVVAGARVAIDDSRGRSTFTKAVRCLSGRMLTETRLSLVRDVCAGATHAPLDFALDRLRRVMSRYTKITDSLGTNSHYCLSVLHFVESLVLAITDLHLATLSPRDDVPELAWPYAL